ncbi:hypothetical protein GCM10011348_16160 [Marinobacterium nitratireducens]|uniref:Uncharacterized protein n=1 Tax=Marinobacterium nitratireducens TaxID=518897 RepID=A0A917ZDW2_9GAMM|nr:hypothetical protein [Marinobacterium nitratireducens]GGO80134.1 hypothetical protein GCM10011348_16160 [Marinobacterium nitratireducens]
MKPLWNRWALCSLLIWTQPGLAQDEALVEDTPPPLEAADDEAVAPAPAQPRSLSDFPPRSDFDEMLQRPLFHSSRRPQVEDSGDGGSAQELRETWKLTGVIVVGDEIKAMFQERNGERRLTLGAGMPLDANWVLDEINMETVILGSGEEQVTLELLEPRDTAPVETAKENGEDAPDDEPGSVDERTREASRQLEEDADAAKEIPDE